MKIELAPDIERRFRRALRAARRREIGGMLFAEQLAPAHFRLIDFSLDSRSGTHANFRRDSELHQRALDAFFELTGRDFSRHNYLGEWHSHPTFDVRPSVEDLTTMTDLVNTPGTDISFALLLIVRMRWRLWMDYSMTVFARGYAPHGIRIAPRFI